MRRRPIIEGILALLLSLASAAPARAATATCKDPLSTGTWRATWTAAGGVATLTKLEFKGSEAGAVFVDASSETWELRWDNLAVDYGGFCTGTQACGGASDPPCPAGSTCAAQGFALLCVSQQACSFDSDCSTGETCPRSGQSFQPENPLQGGLAVLKLQPVTLARSPRVVAPNGGCTVYLNPFANGTSTWKKVAVVGDSLTDSLNDATYNQTSPQGYVQGNLNAAGLRVEVEGQAGRSWTSVNLFACEPSDPLDLADRGLLDELRGLRTAANLRALVIALGGNDAGWVAGNCIDPLPFCNSPAPCSAAEQDAQLQTRLAFVQGQINAILDEVVAWNKCVVLVTTPDNLANYANDNVWHYAWAAQNINGLLRTRANASTTDKLFLRDFAALSANHHTWDADNWFIADNLHLNSAGKLAYTNEIVQGTLLCP